MKICFPRFENVLNTMRIPKTRSEHIENRSYFHLNAHCGRFSQYRQLSGGRFLVSLQEVLRSESIIKLKSLLKRNIDISSLCSPNIPTSLIKDYAQDLLLNDCDHLRLTEDSQQVIVYISGYISLSLAQRLKFS